MGAIGQQRSPPPLGGVQLRRAVAVVEQDHDAMVQNGFHRIELENRLRDDGYKSLYKEVRLPVVEFFEKIGYQAEGDLYERSGLDHYRMKKDLSQ